MRVCEHFIFIIVIIKNNNNNNISVVVSKRESSSADPTENSNCFKKQTEIWNGSRLISNMYVLRYGMVLSSIILIDATDDDYDSYCCC